ncbi:uncharacterized protein LOC134254390 [Saccostrea cucullata]|uniref:uncharacterized protein LOC134254390 n=1 Tax=Saccostrea cuccullata TaxID=36930 RepID=UPI002ECFE94C
MKSKYEIILALLNIFINTATCSTECRRPDGVPCCYNEYFDVDNKTYKENTKISAVTEKHKTINERTKLRVNTSTAPKVFKLEKISHFISIDSTKTRSRVSTIDKSTLGSSTMKMSSVKGTTDHKHENTKMSAVTEKHKTINERTKLRVNTRRESKVIILSMDVTSWPHVSEENPKRYTVNSENSGKELQQISSHLQLITISLFMIFGCVVILIPLLVYYTKKRNRRTEFPIGLKQVCTHNMNALHLTGTMERGYTPLSHRERRLRSGRQSDYSTPQRNGRQSDYSTPQNLEQYTNSL